MDRTFLSVFNSGFFKLHTIFLASFPLWDIASFSLMPSIISTNSKVMFTKMKLKLVFVLKSQFEFERRSIKSIRNKHALQTVQCNLIASFSTTKKNGESVMMNVVNLESNIK